MSSYYVSIRPLCRCRFPINVGRIGPNTLVEVDPRATKVQMLEACADVLHEWEFEAARRAYGQPPVGEPMDPFFVEGLVMPYVPPEIRLPGEPPIQNPYLNSPEGLAAFHAALDWWDLERRMDSVSA